MNDFEKLNFTVGLLDKRKAMDINALEVTDSTTLADYFVIATATSNTHVKSLAGELEDELAKNGVEPNHIEGRATGWILLDYGTMLVHLFTADTREYYNLDRLWSDAKTIDISAILEANKAQSAVKE